MNTGLAAHSHDVLEAVEARTPSDVDGLAVVCLELLDNTWLLEFGQFSFLFVSYLTFNTDWHNKK